MASKAPASLIAVIVALALALAAAFVHLVATRSEAGRTGEAASRHAAARALRDQAFAHLRADRFAEAIDALDRGHRAVPHPNFLLDIALAYDAWAGHCEEAVVAARRFSEACPSCTEGRERIAAIVGGCAAQVTIDSTPIGAAIRVNGKDEGNTPSVLHLVPGNHRLELSLDDHEPLTLEIPVERGRKLKFAFELKRRSP